MSRRYVEESSAAMLATKRSAGVAPEVNLGECISPTPLPRTNKAEPTLALKPRGDVPRSPKQRYQWPLKKKDSRSPKIKKKHLPVG